MEFAPPPKKNIVERYPYAFFIVYTFVRLPIERAINERSKIESIERSAIKLGQIFHQQTK